MTEVIALLAALVTVPPVVYAIGLVLLDAFRDYRQDSDDEPLTINLAPHIRSMTEDEGSDDDYGVCMFCGRKGFEDQDDLEAHIESHPGVKRRE